MVPWVPHEKRIVVVTEIDHYNSDITVSSNDWIKSTRDACERVVSGRDEPRR